MASTIFADLQLNRSYINPNFGGYKLSLDALPIYRTTIDAEIDVVKLPDNLYSYQHLKAFGVHNHVYLDPWNDNSIYLVDKQWRVMKATMQGMAFRSPVEQYVIPDAANRRLIPERLNVSLHFTSASLLVLSDGTGRLYILHSSDRNEEVEWKVGYSGQPLGDDSKHFIILHSVFHTSGGACYVEVICVHVDSNPAAESDDSVSSFITKLEWLTFYSDNETTFELVRTRRLEGLTCPEYTAVMPNGSALVLITGKPFKFVYDSVKPLVYEDKKVTAADGDVVNEEVGEPAYTWSQTNEDVTICFKLTPDVTKADVVYELRSDRISLSLKNSDPLLCGDLFDVVDIDSSTWIIVDDHSLEVHLTKSEAGLWSTLVLGDSRGKLVLSLEQTAEIDKQLEKFTTATENADPEEGRKPAFNAQQLEECDMFPEDSSAIWCFDGETHEKVQQVNISGNQWLFNAATSVENLPVVCLRHDVDGVVWQPVASGDDSSNSPAWQHVGTFDAFGYVQASKQQRKYATCAPSLSWVAIADCVRHIYLYRRPTSISSPLRNRRTGETVLAVARQQLISLESADDIMGVRANNDDLFVLSGKTLYAVRINE